MWILFACISAAFYAVAEQFDSFFVNGKFKHPFTLLFYTSLFNLIFVPVLFIFQPPEVPPISTIPLFILLGLVGIGYLYPYYRGLQSDDTSVAISFFGVSRIFVPVLAFLAVGEVLDVQQYLGILLIILSVTLLGLHHVRHHFRWSK